MTTFRKVPMALALSAAFALPSHADELSDLKAKMSEMLLQVQALQKKQDDMEARQTANAAAKPEGAAPVVAGTLPGSILLPGTNTSLKIGGYVQLAASREMNGFIGNTQTVLSPFSAAAGGIPYSGSQASKRSGETSFEARESRLNVTTLTPTRYGDLRTLIEGDFYGTGGTKASTNSVSFRLRHAMAEIGPWMFGQYWSNSADLMQGPDVYDFGGPVGLAALSRVPQIRYTWKINPRSTFSTSIEQPTQDFSGADSVVFQAGYNNISTNSLDKLPDITARYVYDDTWGRQSFGFVARRLTATNVGGAGTAGAALGDKTLSTTGYSLNNQGTFNVFGRDKLGYHLVWGKGAGRYITQQQPSAVLYPNVAGAPNALDAIKSRGFNISYLHYWNDQWRSTIDYGKVRTTVPHPQLPLTTMSSVESVFANLIWSPVPQAELGLEYAWAKIKNDVPKSGIGSRLSFIGKYKF
ncbi:porin-like protein [Variovorax sp. 54]|uniref:DcaP family trimeric outer membrane transporter n=1 Tax=Variovorax sp. 54 TaxID=2035212 RepID=UPI000C19ADB3|nr:DcaP family trimeric outer membrane transporter [Variovorax sp. 54]PIF73709.1 porin-like protein [Variovorax sp. 54]